MAVGLVSQVSRVLSLQLVTTTINAMAKRATAISVFMVYQESLLQALRSMWLGSLAMLGGRSPMLHGLLVRHLLVSSPSQLVNRS